MRFFHTHMIFLCCYIFLQTVVRFLIHFFAGLVNRLAFVLLLSAPSLFGVQAMESLVDKGLVKAIGLSNFNRRQIEEIWRHSRIKPTNLQIEVHANFPNAELVDFAQSLGMSVTAYAPLGSPGGFRIADAHGKTPAQTLLRYLLQRNLIVVPKSSHEERIVENSKIFDFELTTEEMHLLNVCGLNERQFKFEKFKTHPEYPFNEPF
ncbi:Aldo-keto reductase family 1 member B4 (Aldose reductase) [Fasciola hepatica]|uniref:Aldo-keto reductase family 1 member B4 (Aldose reductase) n=1 Tax=Fasciola hepatica TaxID=6192 RepID=A0A4E0RUC5_FASHE|nr:Aldo-keto reductase family 1 member B4 (Aldose reductase) [Fasciola hepatica]